MKRILLYLTCVLALNAQTRVDLKSQAKSVDFTEAQSTRPIKTGAALPATCVTGDMYLMTSAPAGRNLYACTAANTWSMQAASELPEMTGQANKVLVNDGTSSFWQEAAGDVIGNIADLLVTRLRGRPISPAAPSDGQALIWDANAGRWVPGDITLSRTTDLTAKRTSATVLTIGEACTTSNPCRVRVGTQERVFTSAATVTVLSGTGEIFAYITKERDLTIGYNGTLNLSCPACTTVPNVFAIPSTALSLFRWSVSEQAGEWDATGTDMRSILTSPAGVLPGTGIVITDNASNGSHIVSLDTTVALTKASAQTGQALYCSASGTSSAYLCAMNPQLAIYATGMTVHFRAHVSSAAGATLDIDGLGAKMLLRSDGSEPAAGEFLSGGHYLLLYDGTAFKASGVLPPSPVDGGGGSPLDGMVPTRSSSTVLTVSAGGWRPGGLSGVNTFAGGYITAVSGSGNVLWCLGTDQVYVGATGSLDVVVPAGTNDLGTVAACPDNTIEWWRWEADDAAGEFDAVQGNGNDKRYTAITPASCTSTDSITATRNAVTGACEYEIASAVSTKTLDFPVAQNNSTTGAEAGSGWSYLTGVSFTVAGDTTNGPSHPFMRLADAGGQHIACFASPLIGNRFWQCGTQRYINRRSMEMSERSNLPWRAWPITRR